MTRKLTAKQSEMLSMLKAAGCSVRINAKDKRTAETLVTRGLARRQDGGYRAL